MVEASKPDAIAPRTEERTQQSDCIPVTVIWEMPCERRFSAICGLLSKTLPVVPNEFVNF